MIVGTAAYGDMAYGRGVTGGDDLIEIDTTFYAVDRNGPMTSPAVAPSSFTMSVTETLALGFDATAYLSAGQTVSYPTATLSNTLYGVPITLGIPATASGNIVTQVVSGPDDLVTPGKYLLIINFQASPSTNEYAMELLIQAVF